VRRWQVHLYVGDEYTEINTAVQTNNETTLEGVVNTIAVQLGPNSIPEHSRWVTLIDGRDGITRWRASDIKGFDVAEVDAPGEAEA